MKKQGFTLIEIVVVVGVLGVIMVATTSILINSMRAKNRIELADRVEQNGGLLLNELKNGITSASGTGMNCAGSTLTYTSVSDGGVTNLVCYEGIKIASESANGVFDLTASDVATSGCNNFVQCDLYPGSTDRVAQVNFAFGLVKEEINRHFQSSVVVRN